MELHTVKIESKLKKIGRSKYWLAKQLNLPIQTVLYWFRAKSLRGAEPIAKVLGYPDPKDIVL